VKIGFLNLWIVLRAPLDDLPNHIYRPATNSPFSLPMLPVKFDLVCPAAITVSARRSGGGAYEQASFFSSLLVVVERQRSCPNSLLSRKDHPGYRGHPTGKPLRPLGPPHRRPYGKAYSGQSRVHCSEYARCRSRGSCQPSLFDGQTRWSNSDRFYHPFSIPQPAHREIGNPVRLGQIYLDRFAGNRRFADSPYKTIEDVRTAKEPPKCGATGVTGPDSYLPKLLQDTVGAKFTIVTGYPGGQDIDLAVERGEIHCRAFTIEAFFGREPYHTWRKKSFVRHLFQTGQKRDPRLPDTPTVAELMDQYKTNEAGRRLSRVLLAAGDMGRPMLGPPGIPTDRLKILREAFGKTMNDSQFQEEVKKRNYEFQPVTGEDLERMAKEVTSQSPEVIDRLKKVLGN
jgi:Tripartite tricarboxylate transporter family receptor